MKPVRSVALIAAIVALALGVLVAPAAAKTKITPRHFGVHSYTSDPNVPAGTLRMAGSPAWRVVEPKRGVYNWAAMDATVKRAENWGFTDILFSFLGTPNWAAKKVAHPEWEVFGAGSTGAPANMNDWQRYVEKVVQRYRGRIDYYQAWNEITSPQFYQGSTYDMVLMTRILAAAVRKHDPSAKVVAASVQTHVPQWFNSKAVPYLQGLKRNGWPVDVLAGHFYPAGKGGPDQRMKQIKGFKKTLKKLRAPKRLKLWDTEGNFWVGVKGNPKAGRVRGKKAATFVARNYLDSWRLGIPRSYWYLWSSSYVPFAGVQLRNGDAGTKAYKTLAGWTVGTTFKRCKQSGKLVVCQFKGGKKFVIAFTAKGKAKLKVSGKKKVCPVTGGKCKKAKKRTTITPLPVRIA